MNSTLYFTALIVHIICVATWFGGNIFFIGFVALSRREPFLKNIRARLIYIYATAYRKMTYYLLGLALASGLLLVHANGLLNTQILALPNGKMILFKFCIFVLMLALQLVHDFVIGPRSYQLNGEEVIIRDEYRVINRIAGYFGFLLTCTLLVLGAMISRKVDLFR